MLIRGLLQWFARFSIKNCIYLGDEWQSYCDEGDPFCASGIQPKVHLNYVAKYGKASVDYIVGKIGASESFPSGQGLGDLEL